MADAANLTAFLQQLPIPWLVGNTNGKNWAAATGSVLDDQVSQIKQAIKARMTLLAPADALPHIAHERGLIQGPTESNTAFALRLQDAWRAWSYAGTPLGILLQLYYSLGYTDVTIVQQN